MWGTAARAQTIGPRRLTSSVAAQSVVGHVLQGGVAHDAGVVDEHVEPAPLLGHLVDSALHGEGVGDVGGEGERLAAR